jgi:hypothetical protein
MHGVEIGSSGLTLPLLKTRSAQIDVNHNEPSLDLRMAQIYEREGDKTLAIAQLQHY